MEALMGVTNFISRCTEDHIVLSDCDVICNLDLSAVLAKHEESDADLTIVTRPFSPKEAFYPDNIYVVSSDENNMATDVVRYSGTKHSVEISTNIMVFKRGFLLNLIREASARGYQDFYRDVISRVVRKNHVLVYPCDGLFLQITSLESYFASSMRLLEKNVRESLFGVRYRPIYTKVRNSAPTTYAKDAKVINSYVADGCVIEGTVENSIIFRGVKVGKGTVIRNSILLQDTFTGNNVTLNCVITDKNAVIKDGRLLSGHETMPFFIGKGVTV